MNFFFSEIFAPLVQVVFVIIGFIVQVLLLLAAFGPEGRSRGKAVVATVAWLAISPALFSMIFWTAFGAGITGRTPIFIVVGWLAALYAYGYAGLRLCAWVAGDQAIELRHGGADGAAATAPGQPGDSAEPANTDSRPKGTDPKIAP